MKTRITFDATLLSPAALRTMASAAARKRDEMDGESAAHYNAWANLADALFAKARLIEGSELLEHHKPADVPTLKAEIIGCRTNHPSTGPKSDLKVKYSDGRPVAEGFSYYADAYAHARLTCTPEDITRFGRKARAR